MPEIKNTFTGGRMNKDLDERLVPKGEYTHAVNVEVTTSDNDSVGTVQNLLGNQGFAGNNLIPFNSVCIGAVTDEATDSLYWLTACDKISQGTERIVLEPGNPSVKFNAIFEHNNQNSPNSINPIFVDIHQILARPEDFDFSLTSPSTPLIMCKYVYGIHVGMNVYVHHSGITSSVGVVLEVYENHPLQPNGLMITLSKSTSVWNSTMILIDYIEFTGDVTSWTTDTLVTGINIIDDMLFWTDNESEPKKINIPRSKEGTFQYTDTINAKHTDLIKEGTNQGPIQQPNITVIKPKPTTPITLGMTGIGGVNTGQYGMCIENGRVGGSHPTTNPIWGDGDEQWFHPGNGSMITSVDNFSFNGTNQLDYKAGDVLLLKHVAGGVVNASNFPIIEPDIRARIISWGQPANSYNLWGGDTTAHVEIMGSKPGPWMGATTPSAQLTWAVEKELSTKPLFELKFPRFSYRWKYEDGEYSTFAPWSEIAFLASSFRYLPKEGFNLGMVNNLKELILYDFVPPNTPLDVVQIDLLYKESDSPNVYIVDSLTANDLVTTGANPWNSSGSQGPPGGGGTDYADVPKGQYKVTSETIFATVAPNQLIRNWDAVPKKALAQEMIGNRLVYANYTKNFDLKSGSFTADITTALRYNDVGQEHKSIKSIRDYQVGIVYTDLYGRETPVYTNKDSVLRVEKTRSKYANDIYTKINNGQPIGESYKFYIKETTSKYHNLVMDRWYDAEDGDIWLSFHSHDRNKVDEETFLYLKRGHDGSAVEDDYKYKILSIKNEAPEFIKKSAKQFGIKPNNPNDFGLIPGDFTSGTLYHNGTTLNNALELGTATATTFPYVGAKAFTIAAQLTEDSNWSDLAINKGPDSTKLKVRFLRYSSSTTAIHKGEGQFIYNEEPEETSGWYKISKFAPATSGKYLVNLNKELGNDALFVNPTATLDPFSVGSVANYIAIEITEELAENLPEFDGRFFVKILSNTGTYEYITTDTPNSVVYSQPLYYYNQPLADPTTGLYPAEAGGDVDLELYKDNNAGGYGQYVNDLFVDDNDTDYIAVKSAWAEEFGDGTQLNVTTSANSTNGAKIFIDKLKFQASHWGNFNGAQNPAFPHSLNTSMESDLTPGVGQGINQGNKTIDISVSGVQYYPAPGSWTKENPHVGSSASPNPYWNDYETSRTNDIFWFGADWTVNLSFSSFAGGNNTKDQHAFSGSGSSSSPLSAVQIQVSNFVDNLKEGGRFRFSEDPDAEIYEITGIELLHRWNYLDETMLLNHNDITMWGADWWIQGGFGGIDDLARGWDGNFCTAMPYNTGDGVSNGCYGTTPNIIHNIQDPTITANNRRTTYRLTLDKAIGSSSSYDPTAADCTAAVAGCAIQFLGPSFGHDYDTASETPAVWETEPKEVSDIDIFYQASKSYPMIANPQKISTMFSLGDIVASDDYSIDFDDDGSGARIKAFDKLRMGWIEIENVNQSGNFLMPTWVAPTLSNKLIKIYDKNNPRNYVKLRAGVAPGAVITSINTVFIRIDEFTHNWGRTLNWHNCYSFGNGVESDTIRDDFNQVVIDNGVTASTTVGWSYENERLKNGLIFSGLYNNKTSLNDLNQFIEAENITKDLNPSYGSIQKLHARDSDLVALCEDKVVKILANKDALYNADENSQLIASNNVLGQAQPFIGDWGIGTNPESFAKENFRSYFVDRKRGAVLRLSRDGLTAISETGMKDYFRDTLSPITGTQRIQGSYDTHKSLYNLTIPGSEYTDELTQTVSFNENSKGWPSFKTFVPEKGISMNNDYFTFEKGLLYQHHVGPINRFYGIMSFASLKFIFNEDPSVVKSFTTINYEGTQSRILFRDDDSLYTNLFSQDGWYVNSIQTDKQEGQVPDFVEKEGKWFNHIIGMSGGTGASKATRLSRLDTREFSFQGIEAIEIQPRLISDALVYTNCDGAGYIYSSATTSINPGDPNILISCDETI